MAELVFPQQAVEAQRRLDHLPSAMRVTNSLTMTAMTFLGLTLLGAVVWSGFAEVPVPVEGTAIFVDSSGQMLNAVRAPMEGAIEEILVEEGDYVSPGQVVVSLRLPDRITAFARAESNLATLRDSTERRQALQVAAAEMEASIHATRQAALEQHIAGLRHQLTWRRELEAAQETLTKRWSHDGSSSARGPDRHEEAANELSAAESDLRRLLAEPPPARMARDRENLPDAQAM